MKSTSEAARENHKTLCDHKSGHALRERVGRAKQIVGNRIDDMYKKSPDDLLHIPKFLSANCFEDYITRNGLDLKTREMPYVGYPRTLNAINCLNEILPAK